MKQLNKLAAAAIAVTVILASCAKDDAVVNNQAADIENASFVVKVADAVRTRAVDTQAASGDGSVAIDSELGGYIFVLDGSSVAQDPIALALGEAVEGVRSQTLNITTPKAGLLVYIVANIPTAEASKFEDLENLTEIKAVASDISTIQAGYANVPLANTGDVVVMQLDTQAEGIVYNADVELSPLVSRLELLSVKASTAAVAGKTITGFKVAGVYVNNYYPQFNYGGTGSGTQVVWDGEEEGVIYSDLMGDGAAAVEAVSNVAVAAAGKVWAYNVPSAGAPIVIVAITDVKWTENGIGHTDAGPFYLKPGYSGAVSFARGKIYRLGDTENEFVFDASNLSGLTPQTVSFTVGVSVTGWEVESPTFEL